MDEARITLQEETKFVKEATKAAYPTTEDVYHEKAAIEADPRMQTHRSTHKDSHVQQMAALFPSRYNPKTAHYAVDDDARQMAHEWTLRQKLHHSWRITKP